MPTYEYSCLSCGNSVEVVQKMSDPSLTTCKSCGGTLKKVFHPAGIMFKGSGFYATDNRSKPKTSAKASSDSSDKKSDKSTEKKSDSSSDSSSTKSSEGSKSTSSVKTDKGSN